MFDLLHWKHPFKLLINHDAFNGKKFSHCKTCDFIISVVCFSVAEWNETSVVYWRNAYRWILFVQIRHDNFPPFQADWLLDQVIVEHNHDGTKYIFKCDCWLRKEHPYITLSLLQGNQLHRNSINWNLSTIVDMDFVRGKKWIWNLK